eukprot:2289048-Rhodomonas_salina.1
MACTDLAAAALALIAHAEAEENPQEEKEEQPQEEEMAVLQEPQPEKFYPKKILGHRLEEGELQVLVHFKGYPAPEWQDCWAWADQEVYEVLLGQYMDRLKERMFRAKAKARIGGSSQ